MQLLPILWARSKPKAVNRTYFGLFEVSDSRTESERVRDTHIERKRERERDREREDTHHKLNRPRGKDPSCEPQSLFPTSQTGKGAPYRRSRVTDSAPTERRKTERENTV